MSAIKTSIESVRKVCAERTRNGSPRKSELAADGSAATAAAILAASAAESAPDFPSMESRGTPVTRPVSNPTRQSERGFFSCPAGHATQSPPGGARVTGVTAVAEATLPALPKRSVARSDRTPLDSGNGVVLSVTCGNTIATLSPDKATTITGPASKSQFVTLTGTVEAVEVDWPESEAFDALSSQPVRAVTRIRPIPQRAARGDMEVICPPSGSCARSFDHTAR